MFYSHTVNMLTAVPATCLSVLVAPLPEKGSSASFVEYEGRNLEAVAVLLQILQCKLDDVEKEVSMRT